LLHLVDDPADLLGITVAMLDIDYNPHQRFANRLGGAPQFVRRWRSGESW
jgi:hypothetical protein